MSLEGLQLGRYHLLRLLGSGGMGEVYLAEDSRIDQRVAIKVLRTEPIGYPNSSTEQEIAHLFQREARAIATLDHPNILPLFDFGEQNVNAKKLTYLVMPFRQEGTFADWLRQYSETALLPPQAVSYFISQAASALQHAHEHQIVHQDVKPTNFLIRRNTEHSNWPILLLTDFGIAKFTSATTFHTSHNPRGTPTYMSPEQWEGQPVPATDQYALAVMAYTLLTGRLPFQGSFGQVMYQHMHVPPQPPGMLNPHLTPAIDSVILRALAKKPGDRFPSISLFAHSLQQAVQTLGTPPVGTTPHSGDLHATLTVSRAEAQIGTNRSLTLPGGQRMMVYVPPGTYNGQVLQLEGMGDPHYAGGPKGTLLLTIAITDTAVPYTAFPNSSAGDRYAEPAPYNRGPMFLNDTDYGSGMSGTAFATPYRIEAPPPGAPNNKSRLMGVALVALAVLIIASGGIFFAVSKLATDRANATATAIAPVNATATGRAFNVTATAQTNLNATATAVARSNATATVIASNPDPYTPPQGRLALYEALKSNSLANWDDSIGSNGTCQFKNGVYQVSTIKQSFFLYCVANATNFSNFAYEVQLSIVKGDCGGITFRSNAPKFYFFRICQYGSYALYKYVNNLGSTSSTLRQGTSLSINSGLGQANRIAVVANGSTLTLYVNNHQITSVTDSAYSGGQIGLVASNLSSSLTQVSFNNARVWTF